MHPPAPAHAPPAPPVAEPRPHVVTAPFGAQRSDPYYWLRDDAREDPAVLAYLQAENAHADAVLAPLAPLQEALYAEFTGRIQQDDASVPFREHGWWYYARYVAGQDYPIHARRADAPGMDARRILAANAAGDFAGEQVLLDVNALAAGHAYFSIGAYEVSPDGRLLAWTEDTSGRRQYVVRLREIASGKMLAEAIAGVAPDLVWAADSRTLLYIENDPETLLTVRVKAHVAGSDPAADAVLHEEEDDSFYLGIDRSRDERYLLIHASSTVSDEVRYAPADAPDAFAVLAARERGLEYDADHHGGRWVIRTNAGGATNFKLVTAADGATARGDWRDWIAHDPQVFIEGFELFDGFTVIAERSGGLERLRLLHADGREEHLAADEPAYSMGLDVNSEPDSDWLRYGYTSLTTPATVYETNVRTGERRLLKRQPVPGYDPAQYVTERVWAPARDGTRVPVSIVYRKGFAKDGKAALLQYGYGSYGLSMDPAFSPTVVSLLDRGMAYAIAHIRGGQELGRQWYEDGKLLNKQNTFTDFIDVTDFLVKQGYAAPDRVAAYGGSAGGLLMGAIANMAPQKYRVILSQVPFVDVVTTMLDPSIPLTTNEYDEWGNPEQPEYYQYMLGYSPYDNLRAQAYPAMFVGTGLWDSQVQYWEPAKYVARLRTLDTSGRPLVFRTNMDAGHGGKSGRFRRYREQAEMYAFLLEQLDVAAAG
jgi:oligopeptidase B